MPRILITGVTGFVGANLVSYFAKLKDYSIIGHSRDIRKAKDQFSSFQLEVINDFSSASLNELNVEYVIHLAGIAHDLSNKFKPEDYYEVNFEGTKLLYDEFLRSKATKFIFVSSIKAAVDVTRNPVNEEVIPNPVTDYGKSKLKAEQYIQSRTTEAGKHFYILRPGMIHGPGNKGNLNLLYRFVKSGIPFPFGEFDNQRSFLSVDNFVFIVHQLLDREIQSGIYHLADDGFLSTKELYNLIATTLGKSPKILNFPKNWIYFLAKSAGKQHLVSKLTEDMMISNKKIVNELGVSLPVALREGVCKTIQSFKK